MKLSTRMYVLVCALIAVAAAVALALILGFEPMMWVGAAVILTCGLMFSLLGFFLYRRVTELSRRQERIISLGAHQPLGELNARVSRLETAVERMQEQLIAGTDSLAAHGTAIADIHENVVEILASNDAVLQEK